VIVKKTVLGFPVAAMTREQAVQQLNQWASGMDRAYAVSAADAHVIARAAHDPGYGEMIRRFDLVLPDGMPLLWLINQQLPATERLQQRVSGADLMHLTLSQPAELKGQKQATHFLLGGSEKLLSDLEKTLAEKYPAARIGGVHSPPFVEWPDDEFDRICEKIRSCGATHVWVCLGCPKQEIWIAHHLDRLPPAIYFAVGAAFAFMAGHVPRAPMFFQKSGLEWLYRLCSEPRRLWKRYLTYNSLFLYYWFLDSSRKYKESKNSGPGPEKQL
jgi:N-acetylglucosaminyldiphosphoundecaprenol N-acetyl-beta-D-mannosaminyltransferase